MSFGSSCLTENLSISRLSNFSVCIIIVLSPYSPPYIHNLGSNTHSFISFFNKLGLLCLSPLSMSFQLKVLGLLLLLLFFRETNFVVSYFSLLFSCCNLIKYYLIFIVSILISYFCLLWIYICLSSPPCLLT